VGNALNNVAPAISKHHKATLARRINGGKTLMDTLDRQIINQFQGGFPVVDQPFLAVAKSLGVTESEIMTRIRFMLDDGLLTRFGPLYNIDKMGGTFSLCAMRVPESLFDEIAEKVNKFEQVAHNYERDNELNMWFVIAAESAAELQDTILRIENTTELKVYNFPKQREFYVNFQLSV
jgi:DNA-binding Lrp family transcriptional regulator